MRLTNECLEDGESLAMLLCASPDLISRVQYVYLKLYGGRFEAFTKDTRCRLYFGT